MTFYNRNGQRASGRVMHRSNAGLRKRSRRPLFEPLEDRRVLTTCADWTFAVANNRLTISATPQADDIYVSSYAPGDGSFYVGVWSSYATHFEGGAPCWNGKDNADPDLLAANLTEIEISSRAGDDTVGLQLMDPTKFTALTKATVHGDEGTDTIKGTNIEREETVDWLYGWEGIDYIFGLKGLDAISGGDELDPVTGNDADGDTLDGGDGLDTIVGGAGHDYISGGADRRANAP